jgi:hypothetical protein
LNEIDVNQLIAVIRPVDEPLEKIGDVLLPGRSLVELASYLNETHADVFPQSIELFLQSLKPCSRLYALVILRVPILCPPTSLGRNAFRAARMARAGHGDRLRPTIGVAVVIRW